MLFRFLRVLLTSRFRPRTSAFDTVVTAFRVHPGDLDVIGHMNNGVYLTVADLGRVDLMARSGLWSRMRREGWHPVVAGQTIRYRRSLTLGQRVELHTRVVGTDGHSVFIEQSFVRGGQVCAHLVVRGRFRTRDGAAVTQAEIEDLFGAFPADRRVPGWIAEWADASQLASRG